MCIHCKRRRARSLLRKGCNNCPKVYPSLLNCNQSKTASRSIEYWYSNMHTGTQALVSVFTSSSKFDHQIFFGFNCVSALSKSVPILDKSLSIFGLSFSKSERWFSFFCIVFQYSIFSTGIKYKICRVGRFDFLKSVFALSLCQKLSNSPQTLQRLLK